jgi:hypothetical protein
MWQWAIKSRFDRLEDRKVCKVASLSVQPLIHRSAWKVNSANFALTAFSESRFDGLKEASTTLGVAARIPALVGSTRGRKPLCYTR